MGTSPQNSNWFEFVGVVTGTQVGPCDLFPRLVGRTSPLMCADLEGNQS